ncbi:hypothetical protein BSKO_03722 [Bryopsis sp. KO-2023]|nr:hypothetical protein BSKO_03722 [Bryopsis sp. KO-2023]
MNPLALQHSAPGRVPANIRRVLRKSVSCRAAVNDEVTIRRRPPFGVDKQPCGPFQFKVDLDESNEPRNILEEIVWWKATEIESLRQQFPLDYLKKQLQSAEPARDFKGALLNRANETGRPALIAEVKKASPSKGLIQPDFDAVKIAKGYEEGGATCLSVLTDKKYFQGGFENLGLIRESGVSCPLLCKEFIVEAYQLFLARVSGADAVLLIAAVLPNSDLTYFMKSVSILGMQCLIEVHDEDELKRVLQLEGVEKHLVGINNRNLETFEVDLHNTTRIMESEAGKEALERGILMVGESGIFGPEDVDVMHAAGCKAILVGESIVKQGDQSKAVSTLLGLN